MRGLGGTALILDTAHCKATSAEGKQYAEQESHDGSIGQCISLPCAQLSDGAKGDDEAQHHRQETNGGDGESDESYLILHVHIPTVLQVTRYGAMPPESSLFRHSSNFQNAHAVPSIIRDFQLNAILLV
jgi:hypothetical protein